jgi:hypothetical protein
MDCAQDMLQLGIFKNDVFCTTLVIMNLVFPPYMNSILFRLMQNPVSRIDAVKIQ